MAPSSTRIPGAPNFQGFYEIRLFDSCRKSELQYSDCGGVYGRHIDGQTVGGVAPRINAGK